MPPEPSVTSASVGALVVHLQVVVGAVAEELRAARPEVGEPGDELLGRRGGRLVDVDRGHACSLLGGDVASTSSFGPSIATPLRASEEEPLLRSRGGVPTRGGSRLRSAGRRGARRASRRRTRRRGLGAKPSSHQSPSTSTRASVPVDPRLDPADEAVPEDDRQHVPAPAALRGREEELPHVVEVEQAPEQGAVPDQRIERGEERDRGRRLRRRLQQLDVLAEDEALAAHALDLDRERARRARRAPRAARSVPGSPASAGPASRGRGRRRCRRRRRRRAGRGRGSATGACAAAALAAAPRARARRPAAAVRGGRSSGGCRRAARGRARPWRRSASSTARHGVRRHAEPVGRRPALALEVERRQRAFRADPLEHPLGHLGVLGEELRRVPAQHPAEPGELARRARTRAPCCTPRRSRGARRARRTSGVVVGDPRVQHEVVAPAGDRERVELDRAEPADRPRGRRPGLPRATAPARGSAARRESGARLRP